ncbi:MAG: TadE/TadG family type IV pilus assembly protein [Rhodoblastus sp.]
MPGDMIRSKTGTFFADGRGSVSILFAGGLLAMLVMVGAAIDMIRLYQYKQTVQTAADVAVSRAVSGTSEKTAEQAISDGRQAFASASAANRIVLAEPVSVAAVKSAGAIESTVTATARLNLLFGRLLAIPSSDVSVRATARNDIAARNERLIKCHAGLPADVKKYNCGA